MAKLPFMQFYPQDWLCDTRMCTDAEKAVLIDLICFMWNAPRRGVVAGHPQDVARMVGKEWTDFLVIVEGLRRKGLLDMSQNVTEGHNDVTLMSRRMVRDESERMASTFRKRDQRDREKKRDMSQNVTPDISEVIKDLKERRVLKTDSSKEKIFVDPADNDAGPTPEHLMALWNERAFKTLPRASLLNTTRKVHATARLREFPELTFWQQVIERVNASKLLRGETGPWKCTFDWILSPTNLTKIVEGNYDDSKRH